MNVRLIASLSVCAIVSWSPVPTSLAAQTPSATEPAKNWTQPRTPDGQPDLQGYWTSLSFTPMERPAKYGSREFLTDEEMAEVFRAGVKQSYEFTFSNSAETPVYDATIYGLDAWQNVAISLALLAYLQHQLRVGSVLLLVTMRANETTGRVGAFITDLERDERACAAALTLVNVVLRISGP